MASGIAKVAVALVLLRLTNRSDMRAARIVLWITIGVIIILTAVVTLIFALQCRPLSVAWGVGTGTCISNSVIGQAALALSVEDVATSWLSAVHILCCYYTLRFRLLAFRSFPYTCSGRYPFLSRSK